jgi:hypothetical protein
LVVVAEVSNAIVVLSDANATLSPDALAGVVVGHRDVLVSQFETADATIQAFFEQGKAAGGRMMLNPSPWRGIAPAL